VRGKPTALVAAVIAVPLIAACGTTVSGSRLNTANGGGSDFSVPSTAPGATGGVPGQSTTGVPGAQSISGGSTGGTGGVVPGGTGTTGSTSGSTAPIKVGFMYSLNDAAPSAGVDNNITVDPGTVTHALVNSFNASGGFAGRHIEPVYASLKSSSNNFEGDLAAACATFTQDKHVVAVMSTLGIYSESFMACLAKAGIPVISSDASDVRNASQFPLLVTPNGLLGDTREIEVVNRLKATGFLTTRDNVGPRASQRECAAGRDGTHPVLPGDR
jgi:hypothetical protein